MVVLSHYDATPAPPETIIVTGYSSAPKNTPTYTAYGVSGVVFEVDPSSRLIHDAEFFVVTEVAQNFLKRNAIGYRLPDDAEEICERIRARYIAPSANALAIAVRNASRRLTDHLDKSPNADSE